jgi:hypothetical protein
LPFERELHNGQPQAEQSSQSKALPLQRGPARLSCGFAVMLAEVFRGKFTEAMKEIFAQGQLGFHGSLKPLGRPTFLRN